MANPREWKMREFVAPFFLQSSDVVRREGEEKFVVFAIVKRLFN